MRLDSVMSGAALQNFSHAPIRNSPSPNMSHTYGPCVPFPRAAPLIQPGHPQTDVWQSFQPITPPFHPPHFTRRHHRDYHPSSAQQAASWHDLAKLTKMQTRPPLDQRVAVPHAGMMPHTPPARHQRPVQSMESSPERPPYFQIPSPILYNPHLTALRPTWYREHHLSDLPREMQVSANSKEEYQHSRSETQKSLSYDGREYHLHASVAESHVSATSREDYLRSPARPVIRLPEGGAADTCARRGADVQDQTLVYGQQSHASTPPSISQGHSHSPQPHPVRPQQSAQQPLRYDQSHYGLPATHPQNHQAYHTNQPSHPLPPRPPPTSNIHDPIYQSYPFHLFPLGHHGYPSPTVSASLLNRPTPAANFAARQQHSALSKNWRERSWHLHLLDQPQHRQSR